MLEHGYRFEALPIARKDHMLWNYAGDCAINQVLDDAHMPWTVVTPVRYENIANQGVERTMPTEVAYSTMVEYREQHPEENSSSDCGSVSGGVRRQYELDPDDERTPASTTTSTSSKACIVASSKASSKV